MYKALLVSERYNSEHIENKILALKEIYFEWGDRQIQLMSVH